MLFTWRKKARKHSRNTFDIQGMSMIEILIVVAIMAVLSTVMISGMKKQISKAQDARRKADIGNLRKAFEEYYDDNESYPDLAVLANCGSAALSPYLREIPCDPEDESSYVGFSLAGDWGAGFRILTKLSNLNDRSIGDVGCDPDYGCSFGDTSYNYGVAIGAPITAPEWEWVVGP